MFDFTLFDSICERWNDKNMRKGFAPIVALAIAVAFLIGIGAAVGYFKLKPKPTATPQSTSTPADLSSDTQVLEDETADWKTYTDPKNIATIKYPQSWSLGTIPIDVLPKESIQTIANFVKEKEVKENSDPMCKNCLVVHSQKEVTVAGKTAIVQEVNSHPVGRNMRAYLLKNDSEVVFVNGFPIGKNFPDVAFTLKDKEEFNQILSTFRFTN